MMSEMSAEIPKLHVVFFPMMGDGHMIPILDLAKLFAAHNIKSTIITTPYNAPIFTKPLERYKHDGPQIDVDIIPFPSKETGLQEGIENFGDVTSPEMTMKLWRATQMLKEPLEQVLEKYKPNALVADKLFPFATQVAAKFNIPRLVYHGTSFFTQCVIDALTKYEPHNLVSTDEEEFVLPGLPHEIKMSRLQLADHIREKDQHSELVEFLESGVEADVKSYGAIVNTFYELEPDYADHYRKVLGRRAWHVGPFPLCNKQIEAKFQRGKDSSIDENECLRWLNSKKPNSVIYVCFGTLSMFSAPLLHEIATSLEACEQEFIWVIKGSKSGEEKQDEEWLYEFEKRMEGKGLIIRGWAPQMLILGHESIGAFVTHCGYNSILEAISFGVPMITWPVFADQFYNEKLVTEVAKIGISVGAKRWGRTVDDDVKGEDIHKAIKRVMVDEEGVMIRNMAKELKEKAKKAVEEGGSSYSDLNSLFEELGSYHG